MQKTGLLHGLQAALQGRYTCMSQWPQSPLGGMQLASDEQTRCMEHGLSPVLRRPRPQRTGSDWPPALASCAAGLPGGAAPPRWTSPRRNPSHGRATRHPLPNRPCGTAQLERRPTDAAREPCRRAATTPRWTAERRRRGSFRRPRPPALPLLSGPAAAHMPLRRLHPKRATFDRPSPLLAPRLSAASSRAGVPAAPPGFAESTAIPSPRSLPSSFLRCVVLAMGRTRCWVAGLQPVRDVFRERTERDNDTCQMAVISIS